MTTPRNSHTITVLPDGRVLAVGGWDGADTLASAELYDSATQTWTPTAALRVARAYHSAVLLPDGRALVAGGWDRGGQPLASAELYDPAAARVWTPVPDMQVARAGHTAVWLPTGKALVVGGCTGDAALASAELYDPTMNIWTPAASLREARCWHTATLLPDGQVLVVGGRDSRNQALASAELYDPKANAWTPAAAPQASRQDHTATLLPDGSVLVVGGYNGRYLTDAERYDTARNAWSPAGSLNTARAYHSAILLRNGMVLVAGGANGSRPSASVELYEPTTHAWTAAAALPAPYEAHRATLLRDGRVLITGRLGSDDPTGNDGFPTPIGGVQTGSRPQRTPQASGIQNAPPPTATPRPAGVAAESAAAAAALESMAMAQATLPPNYTEMQETATLYGVHEINFSYSPGSSNPFDISIDVTFTPPGGPAKTVRAFWDGDSTWRARVYVDRPGIWSWTSTIGGSGNFTVSERPESELRGMLRVGTSPKRWYTDDGRTFLPMADTAYKLFFETPTGLPTPNGCPSPRDPTNADAFMQQYVEALGPKEALDPKVNVLRVTSLGTWAYENAQYRVGESRADGCETDLSLFWSSDVSGQNQNMYDGAPTISQVTSSAFYPNLQSFQRTDRKLRWLLDHRPDLYVQILLVPEPKHTSMDHTWRGIDANVRKRLWDTMIAHWAAFPNVLWSVSSDLDDTKTNNAELGKEVGCYFAGVVGPACTGVDNFDPNKPAHDPWHQNRPMSLGHLRNRIDSFATAPWHTYITAYSAADLSAQQMDGSVALPEGCHNAPQIGIYQYADASKPTFNVEDEYEGSWSPNPAYFYRRFFWSYLLSRSGATYGGDLTSEGKQTYTSAGFMGLEGVKYINDILHDARIDLSQFTPADSENLVTMTYPPAPTPAPANWAEFNRPQVAWRGGQELLAYIPNTSRLISSLDCPGRRSADADATPVKVTVDLTKLINGSYVATWYNPADGTESEPIAYTGQEIQAPFERDAVLHISPSWCPSPNACEPMDDAPPLVYTNTLGFKAGADQNTQLVTDTRHIVLGYPGSAAWRCDRLPATETAIPGCWVRYDFDMGRTVASADFHYRRNSASAYQGVYFMVVRNEGDQQIVDGASLNVWVSPQGALHVDSDTESDVITPIPGVATATNRRYHLFVRAEKASGGGDARCGG